MEAPLHNGFECDGCARCSLPLGARVQHDDGTTGQVTGHRASGLVVVKWDPGIAENVPPEELTNLPETGEC